MKKFFAKLKAFSLIEIMISLLVVSAITAAFAPVISKKIKQGTIYAGGQNIIKSGDSCSQFNHGEGKCKTCFKQACINCDYPTCTGYLSIRECKCTPCNSEECERCNSSGQCLKCNTGNYIGSDKKCHNCTYGKFCDGSSNIFECSRVTTNCEICASKNICTKCKNEYYLSSNSCKNCEAGYFCNGINHEICPDKTYSLGDATNCVKITEIANCVEYSKTSNTCATCKAGYYLKDNSCIKCPAGSYCPDGVNISSCTGTTYSTEGATSCSNSTNASNCASINHTTGACAKCNNGYYVNNNSCTKCSAGSYCDGYTKKDCTGTTYSTEGATSCSNSTAANCATYSKTENKCATCKYGYVMNNNKCELDTYYKLVYGLYVTKYNMGDYKDTQIASSANITIANAGSNCRNTKCCWTGSTSGSNCDASNGNYSGCNRTVCNWAAANAICANYKQDGRTWRLPTTGEMGNWVNYSVGLKNNGLMLCDSTKNANSAQCYSSNACSSKYNSTCNAYSVWSSDVIKQKDTSNILLGGYSYYYFYLSLQNGALNFASYVGENPTNNIFSGGIYGNNKYENYAGLSVRCVSDSIANCVAFSGSNTCTSCKKNYYLSNGKCTAVTKQEGCTAYSSTENKCITCEDAYDLNNGKCTFACKGSYYLKIGKLCVMKKNVGNFSTGTVSLFMSSYGVTEKSVDNDDKKCSDEKCCWYGNISGNSCDSSNGDYSGCNREVCNWAAANTICSKIKTGGKTWRLPSTSEMSNWLSYSKGKGNNGLMLCDMNSGYSSAQCGYKLSCSGATLAYCGPDTYWSNSKHNYYVKNGNWGGPDSNGAGYARSTRCVTSM